MEKELFEAPSPPPPILSQDGHMVRVAAGMCM
jgi:hypothetical protein